MTTDRLGWKKKKFKKSKIKLLHCPFKQIDTNLFFQSKTWSKCLQNSQIEMYLLMSYIEMFDGGIADFEVKL